MTTGWGRLMQNRACASLAGRWQLGAAFKDASSADFREGPRGEEGRRREALGHQSPLCCKT